MKRTQTPRQTLTAPISRQRFAFVAIIFICWSLAIGGKLFWLQIVKRPYWVNLAARQQTGAFEVAPRRGVLYDRNLKELAMTIQVDSIYAVPSELGENRESASQMLASIVHVDPTDNFTSQHQMLARFNASRGFAWVARKVDAETSQRIRELNLKGVYVQK